MNLKTDRVKFYCDFPHEVIKGEKHLIKGFVSMNTLDRAADLVPPEAFDLDTYMTNPIIKYNHEWYKDANGNKQTVGHALFVYEAEIVDIEDKDFWGIKNLSTDKVTDSFKKSRLTSVVPGVRGLWTVGQITQEKVWESILRGEMQTFSWAGYARIAYLKIGKEEFRVFTAIDLHEYSPVFVPCNPQATFDIASEISKALSEKEQGDDEIDYEYLSVHSISFSDEVYSSERAHNWLLDKGFEPKGIVNSTEGSETYLINDAIGFAHDEFYSLTPEKGVFLRVGYGYLRDSEEDGDVEEDGDEEKSYICECLDCKHVLESEEHCRDITCPKCGGEMRRKERPGVGRGFEEEISKAVVPFKKWSKAPAGAQWSFRAEDGNRIIEKGGWEQFKAAHTWFNGKLGNVPEVKYAYKLPHHKYDMDGGFKTFLRGVMAGMAIINGARGGSDIPDNERKGCYNHLAKHYKEYGKEPPSFKSMSWKEFILFHKDQDIEFDEDEFALSVDSMLDACKTADEFVSYVQENLISDVRDEFASELNRETIVADEDIVQEEEQELEENEDIENEEEEEQEVTQENDDVENEKEEQEVDDQEDQNELGEDFEASNEDEESEDSEESTEDVEDEEETVDEELSDEKMLAKKMVSVISAQTAKAVVISLKKELAPILETLNKNFQTIQTYLQALATGGKVAGKKKKEEIYSEDTNEQSRMNMALDGFMKAFGELEEKVDTIGQSVIAKSDTRDERVDKKDDEEDDDVFASLFGG